MINILKNIDNCKRHLAVDRITDWKYVGRYHNRPALSLDSGKTRVEILLKTGGIIERFYIRNGQSLSLLEGVTT